MNIRKRNIDASATGISLFNEMPELYINERFERSIRSSMKNEFIKNTVN